MVKIVENVTIEGRTRQKVVESPSIDKVLYAISQRGLFKGITRFRATNYNIEDSLKIVQAIGKSRNPRFVIDADNRFAYENIIKWVHGDETMKSINPHTGEECQGRLKQGIFISGSTGSGKSWCLEIILAYCLALGIKIMMFDDENPRPLWSKPHRADEICDEFMHDGTINDYKKCSILCLQDVGSEPEEILYMGNRVDVIRQLIEYRGDNPGMLTLITSNMKMGGDKIMQRYGDRAVSRLCEMCNYFEIKGKDRRKL